VRPLPTAIMIGSSDARLPAVQRSPKTSFWRSRRRENGCEGPASHFTSSRRSSWLDSTHNQPPNASSSQIRESILLICEVSLSYSLAPCSQRVVTRPASIRDLRVEDANTINNHLPLVAARLVSSTTTPEKVMLIANEVQLAVQPLSFRG